MPQTIQQAFEVGVRHQREGRLQEAERIYRQILPREPGNADALHMLGVIAWQVGRHEGAAELIRKAIGIKPDYPEAFYNLGNALRGKGELDEAIEAFRRAVALRPGFAKAYSNLGVALFDKGQLDEAIAAQRQAISIKQDFPEAYYNLGNALREKGRLDEAIAAFRQAILFNPNFADAHYNLGNAYRYLGDLDEAAAAFRRAIAIKPKFREARSNLGTVLLDQGLMEEAVAEFREAVAIDPDRAVSYQALARGLEIKGDVEEAIAVLKAARERAPGLGSSSYDLAALGAGEAPAVSPRQYVIELFDDYSGHFEEHLVKRLEYRGPELLFEAVSAAMPGQRMDVIDIGCGTGLCGEIFRPMAGRLVGVDLAPRMVEKARRRGIYDELKAEDFVVALKGQPRSFDLVVAGDVFIYVGRLDEAFEAAAGALRPGGLFAFTIESCETGDYQLRRSRRYAQSAAYIRRLAGTWRFEEVSMKEAVLRTEESKPVDGLVIVLRAMGE